MRDFLVIRWPGKTTEIVAETSSMRLEKNLPSAFFIVQRPHPSQDDRPRPEIPASNTRVVPFYLFSFIRFLAFNFQKFNFKRTVFDIQ